MLSFASEYSWVFAHELAHLAHFHMTDAQCDALDEMFAALDESEFVLTSYQSRNTAEFFAVAYEDYLRNLYRLPYPREGLEYLAPHFIDQLL